MPLSDKAKREISIFLMRDIQSFVEDALEKAYDAGWEDGNESGYQAGKDDSQND